MSDSKMDIIETTVKHNVEDIRELKKKVEKHEGEISDLKTNQRVTTNALDTLTTSINELKLNFSKLNDKLDHDKEDQLKQYKSAIWKVAIAIITAFFLISLGLK